MTEPQDPLQARLANWFGAEVRRAERDFSAGVSVRVAEPRSRPVLPVTAVLGAVMVLLLLVVSLRPATFRSQPGDATAPPSSSSMVKKGVVLGEDRLPITLEGERVVRIGQLAAALREDDEAIVAGWFSRVVARCAAPPRERANVALLPWCNPDRLLTDPASIQPLPIVTTGVAVEVGWVALRVHWRDPRAADCPASLRTECDAAIIVDEVVWRAPDVPAFTSRFTDGIPSEIGGEPVLRPADLADNPAEDGRSFLLGGWHSADVWRGCGRIGQVPHPLLDDCSPEKLRDTPGGDGPALMEARELPDGPIVVVVHSDDPRSATCPERELAACRAALVVESLAWAGDEVTAAAPLTPIHVARVLREVADLTLVATRPPEGCDPGFPPVVWAGSPSRSVGIVLIYRDAAAASAVIGNLHTSGWTGTQGDSGCTLSVDGPLTWRWIRVENVIVQMTLTLPTGTPRELDVAARITEQLEEAALR